jgi:hypothetical protein
MDSGARRARRRADRTGGRIADLHQAVEPAGRQGFAIGGEVQRPQLRGVHHSRQPPPLDRANSFCRNSRFFWPVPRRNCNSRVGEAGRAQDLKNLEKSLDKEAFAMRTPISRGVWPKSAPVVQRWKPRAGAGAGSGEDTPYSSYLRSWIAHQAVQHRNLLRNIDAAARIGLAPGIFSH